MDEPTNQHSKSNSRVQGYDAAGSEGTSSTKSEENLPDQLDPTPTVKGVLKQFSREPASTVTCTQAILNHSDHRKVYAGGLLISLELKETGEQKTAQEWLDQVLMLLDPSRILALADPDQPPALHGRLVIIGLALLDRQLYGQLERNQAFTALVDELRPPLKSLSDILSDQSRGQQNG